MDGHCCSRLDMRDLPINEDKLNGGLLASCVVSDCNHTSCWQFFSHWDVVENHKLVVFSHVSPVLSVRCLKGGWGWGGSGPVEPVSWPKANRGGGCPVIPVSWPKANFDGGGGGGPVQWVSADPKLMGEGGMFSHVSWPKANGGGGGEAPVQWSLSADLRLMGEGGMFSHISAGPRLMGGGGVQSNGVYQLTWG